MEYFSCDPMDICAASDIRHSLTTAMWLTLLTLDVPNVRRSTVDGHSFQVAAKCIWNALTVYVTTTTTTIIIISSSSSIT